MSLGILKPLFEVISRWRWQPKGKYRRLPYGIPRRTRGSHCVLKLKIDVNVTALYSPSMAKSWQLKRHKGVSALGICREQTP